MQRFLTLFLMSILATAAVAQTVDCPETESARIAALLTNATFQAHATTEFGTDVKKPMYVVAYDHIYDKWTTYTWDGSTLKPYEGDVTPSGETLKIELPPKGTAMMFATRSNPFFFRGMAKPVTVADSDDVKQLETFAGLAGNFLKSFVTIAGTNRGVAMREGGRTTEVDDIITAAVALRVAVEKLTTEATEAGALQSQTLAYAQMVELRQKPRGSLPATNDLASAASELSAAGADVRAKRDDLKRLLDPYCPELSTDATAALALLNAEGVTKAEEVIAAADNTVTPERTAAQATIRKAKLAASQIRAATDRCTSQISKDKWKATVETIRTSDLDASRKALLQIIDVIGGGHEAVTKANEALAKEPGALKIAAWLGDVATVVKVYGRDGDACRFIDSPVLVRSGSLTAKTGKKLTGGFVISKTVDTTNLHLTHPETVTRSVEVSTTSKWGLGVGVVYTPLDVKSWTLDETTRVVSKAKEETLSGQTALFANFHPGKWTAGPATFGVQVGFNTSTDKPAIYTGFSADLGKWLRLGSGYSFHRNKRLGGGQTEGATLPAGIALQTEDYFPGAWYASLSLSLDGIPLFK